MTPSAVEAAPPELDKAGPSAPPPPAGTKAVGSRVGVWWIDDAQFYYGTVRQFDAETGGHCPLGPLSMLFLSAP